MTMSDQPVLDLVSDITRDSIERADLDPQSLMLVRLAALVAVDAPPASYVVNLAVADELGLTAEQVRAVLIGVMPIVGGPRVIAAIGHIARGLGMVVEAMEEMEESTS
jgi:alkylhydroperoxidase/carboxymuconolactone decarboxylase family protein YurZ